MHLMDWTATIMDFGGIDPARANPDFDGMSFKDTFYNGNDISPSPRKDLFMFMNGSPAVSSNQFHEYLGSIRYLFKINDLFLDRSIQTW